MRFVRPSRFWTCATVFSLLLTAGSRALEVAPADFEAILKDARGTVLVRITCAVGLNNGVSYSGTVTDAMGVRSVASGSFSLVSGSPKSVKAELTNLGNNLPPITLMYTRDGGADALSVAFSATPGSKVDALRAVRPARNQNFGEANVWVYRLDNASTSDTAIAAALGQMDGLVKGADQTALDQALGLREQRKANLLVATKQRDDAKAAYEDPKAAYADLVVKVRANDALYQKALDDRTRAQASLDEKNAALQLTSDATKVALFGALKTVQPDQADFVSGFWVDALSQWIESRSPQDTTDGAFGQRLAPVILSAKGSLSVLKDPAKRATSSKGTGWDSDWGLAMQSYLKDLGLELEWVFPATMRADTAKTLFVASIAPKLQAVIEAEDAYLRAGAAVDYAGATMDTYSSVTLEESYVTTHPDFDWDAYDNAQQALTSANAEVDRVTALLGEAEASVASQTAALNRDKGRYEALVAAKSALAGFRGYGVATVTVPNVSNGGAWMAIAQGVGPDGQSWTYAAPLRAVDGNASSGAVFLGFPAGTGMGVRPLVGRYTVEFPTTPATSTAAGNGRFRYVVGNGDGVSWGALACETAALAPVSAVPVTSTKNYFGGGDGMPLVVQFGNRVAGQSINGFGAVLSKANSVSSQYLVARAGSSLSLSRTTLNGATVPAFSGKFALSAGASPTSFSGVLAVDGAGATKGFGSLKMDANTTIPLSVVVGDSALIGNPAPAQLLTDLTRTVAWSSLSAGSLALAVSLPVEPSVTRVYLMKGGSLQGGSVVNASTVASGEMDAMGKVKLSTAATSVVTGNDYRIRIVREYVTGPVAPVDSGTFTIEKRPMKAKSFQTLLSYAGAPSVEGGTLLGGSYDLGGTPNGNPYRGRLKLDWTTTGSFSGKVEFIDLKGVADEKGVPASEWVADAGVYPVGEGRSFGTRFPKLAEYAVSGNVVLVPAPTLSNPERLTATVALGSPSGSGAPPMSLALEFKDRWLEAPLDGVLKAGTLVTECSASVLVGGTVNAGSFALKGSSVEATAGVSGVPTSNFMEAGVGLGWRGIRSTYQWSYGRGATVSYTWKQGAVPVTGSANVGVDGQIPVFLKPTVLESSTLNYAMVNPGTSRVTTVRSDLNTTGYGMMNAAFVRGVEAPGSTSLRYTVSPRSLLFLTGATVEQVAGVNRVNTGWSPVLSKVTGSFGVGGFGRAEAMLEAVAVSDTRTDYRVAAGKNYRLVVQERALAPREFTVAFTVASGTPANATLITRGVGGGALLPVAAVVPNLSVDGRGFAGTVMGTQPAKSLSVSGSYAWDVTGTEPLLMARGWSTDGVVSWSLYRVTTP